MAVISEKKQKLIIQDILSSPEVFSRTSSILKPSYFDPEFYPVVDFIHEYYGKYRATPSIDIIQSEYDIDIEETKRVPSDRVEYLCDEIERFCKETAVHDAINDSLPDIENQEFSKVLDRVTQAVNISLQKDMGVDVSQNVEERLHQLIEEYTPIPCLIGGIDGPLDDGLVRKQFTLFSANSGGGKSIMLANLAVNYARQGYHTVYLSLELPAEMVFLRTSYIISGVDSKLWKTSIPEISGSVEQFFDGEDPGSIMIKRLKQHSTASDIMSYISFYEMQYDRKPDVLIIDYLDLMDPNGGVSNIGIFEQDKRKSEEVVEILHSYDMIGLSASQQNRDAISIGTPNQSIIAGGISKINTVDNYISLYMDEVMRVNGEMNAYFLKTRSSSGVGKMSQLKFNPANLRVTDPKDGAQTGVMPTKRKGDKEKKSVVEELEKVNPNNIGGLPGVEETQDESTSENTGMFDDASEEPIMPKLDVSKSEANSIISLMSKL